MTVGDTFPLTVVTGTLDLRVAGIFEDDNPIVWAPLVTTPVTYDDAGFPPQDSFLVINASDNSAATRAALEGVVKDNPLVSVKDQAAFAAEQREPIDQLVLMIFALLGLALVIAILGIVNTLALSVIERTREVGLLRAVGTTRGQMRGMITLESIVIAVLGALLGVAMGIVFGVAMLRALRDEGLEVITLPGVQLTAFLLSAVVIGVLAAYFPARRAARLDVLAAIATE